MKVLITGGTGFVGTELREMLLKDGHQTVVISRNPQKHQIEGVKNEEFMSWEDDLSGIMNDVDAVINLAGENIFGQTWTDEVKKRIMDSRIGATGKLVEAMRACENPPAVFVSASASGYYGPRGDDIVDEKEQPASDFLAQVCVKWEAEAKAAKPLGVRVAIPRIGIVLEREGGALQKMIPPFQWFAGGAIGSGKQFMPWIHRTDLCRALLFPLENETFEGAYNACAPEPVSMEVFSWHLGSTLNRPSLFRVPEFVVRILFGEAAEAILTGVRMVPARLMDAGFNFYFEEVDEALADII